MAPVPILQGPKPYICSATFWIPLRAGLSLTAPGALPWGVPREARSGRIRSRPRARPACEFGELVGCALAQALATDPRRHSAFRPGISSCASQAAPSSDLSILASTRGLHILGDGGLQFVGMAPMPPELFPRARDFASYNISQATRGQQPGVQEAGLHYAAALPAPLCCHSSLTNWILYCPWEFRELWWREGRVGRGRRTPASQSL